MSRRSTLCGFIAAATATVVSGLVYRGTTANLAAIVALGEGSPQEIKSALNARNLSLLTLYVLGILTVILFTCFIAQKRRDEKSMSA